MIVGKVPIFIRIRGLFYSINQSAFDQPFVCESSVQSGIKRQSNVFLSAHSQHPHRSPATGFDESCKKLPLCTPKGL